MIVFVSLANTTIHERLAGYYPSGYYHYQPTEPERRHGSTRAPGHAFLVAHDILDVYIYYITAAGNSISSQLGSSYQDCRYRTEKQGIRPVHRIQNHRVTFLQPARRAALLGQPSIYSLRPHWLEHAFSAVVLIASHPSLSTSFSSFCVAVRPAWSSNQRRWRGKAKQY